MTRPDSIRAKGLEVHVNTHCEAVGIDYRYTDLDKWLRDGDEFGEPVKAEWLRRRFKVSRPTMEKWIIIYKENRNG